MASFGSTTTVDAPGISSGHGGILPPRTYGDNGRPNSGAPDYATRLRRARLGLLVALTPIFMLFISFTSAYLVRQGLPTLDPATNKLVSDWIPVRLPVLLFFNTSILLLSSIFMEFARRRAKSEIVVNPPAATSAARITAGDFPWLPITLILGLGFLYGQWLAWRQLAASGFYVTTAPSSSFVYLLTGAHAVHLFGGILVLFVACLASFLRFSAIRRSIVVDITAWYWHFMTVLWVYILCLLEFAR
ncbi:MAG TPA: cytochrome c oxidase subunit 3 [Candidatus Limnocylindrales bacterium]|nr:cytochrome c oxidase subunit 3 [Candidatus Limnocylindrales bacterium]